MFFLFLIVVKAKNGNVNTTELTQYSIDSMESNVETNGNKYLSVAYHCQDELLLN